jgi:hypothetical protein
MAFATTNVKRDYAGVLKITHGQWSGVAGDSDGSIGVEGGIVYAALFTSQDSSGGQIMWPVRVTTSTTGSVTTVTVKNTADVTNGRFIIWHL